MLIERIDRSFNPLLFVAVIISIFTYMWNPLGYPHLRYDDGTYIGRAMHVLVNKSPQEGTFYDHPYFGQIFLAGIFWLAGFPSSLAPSADIDVLTSVKMLWLLPKAFIGSLAVVDTFLIYKVAERRYNNRTVAFIASILFAIMPMWWSLRVLYLESFLLPLLLSSILFATYTKHPKYRGEGKKRENISLVLISGLLMGLAIFTKIPIFAFVPLVAYVIFTNNKSLKTLGVWFIPVVVIPLIWPTYALFQGHLDAWWEGVYIQTHRQHEGMTLGNALMSNFSQTPIFFGLGLSGLVFAIIKRDYFLILWAIPFLIFLYTIGFVRDFHLIPLLPALYMSTSRLIVGLSSYIPYQKVRQTLALSIISVIAIFGLVNIAPPLIMDGNVNDNKFALAAFVTRYLEDNRNDNITVISNHVYSWIPKYVFGLGNIEYRIPDDTSPPKNEKVMLVVDGAFRLVMSLNDTYGQSLRRTYNLYSSNETTTSIDAGRDKVVLPKVGFSDFTRQQEIDLINDKHSWKARKDAEVSQTDGGLIISSKTNGTEKTSRHAIMRTELEHESFTISPLLLSLEYGTLEYGTKSSKTNTTYFIQIREKDAMSNNFREVIFRHMLDNTQGNITKRFFILPTEIADKPVEFRLGINSNVPGEHILAVKRAGILSEY